MIIFARTKVATEELAERLQARGLAAAAINGDLAQAQRERAIQQLKDGKLDILVATDVAARGLDVERISHVLNYDIPYDTESYVHRIGRTGRAGREGDAILFVTPRERNMLRQIERATRQPIEIMELPSVQTVNDLRITRFKDRITTALAASDLGMFRSLIEQYEAEHDVPAIEIAAALARLAQGDKPLLLDAKAKPERREFDPTASRERKDFASRSERGRDERPQRAERSERPRADRPPHPRAARTEAFSNPAEDGRKRVPETREPRAHAASEHRPAEPGMETFRVEVGHMHGVKPGNIVGAIANEAELDSKHIGRITIREDHSLVDLPEGMPPEILQHLKKAWVAGQRLRISRGTAGEPHGERDEATGQRGPRAPRTGAKPKHFARSGGGHDKPRKKY